MIRIKNIFWFFLLGMVLCACSKESKLEPSGYVENYFEVPESATDPESLLRKEFQKENGVYLLFNDTLRRELLGVNADNQPVYFVETVDLSYNFVTSTQNKYEFEYFTGQGKKEEATSFIKKFILPVMDKSVYPYSFLLIDRMIENEYYSDGEAWEGDYIPSDVEVQVAYRCLALALGKVLDLSADEQKIFAATVFRNMLSNKLSLLEKTTLASFFAIGEEYYDRTIYEDLGITDVRELGFLEGEIWIDEDDVMIRFPSKLDDLNGFIDAVFTRDEESFKNENADYPLAIEKYKMLKSVIQDMGYHPELLTQN